MQIDLTVDVINHDTFVIVIDGDTGLIAGGFNAKNVHAVRSYVGSSVYY